MTSSQTPVARNWENPRHVDKLARMWNVDPAIIPHWAPLAILSPQADHDFATGRRLTPGLPPPFSSRLSRHSLSMIGVRG